MISMWSVFYTYTEPRPWPCPCGGGKGCTGGARGGGRGGLEPGSPGKFPGYCGIGGATYTNLCWVTGGWTLTKGDWYWKNCCFLPLPCWPLWATPVELGPVLEVDAPPDLRLLASWVKYIHVYFIDYSVGLVPVLLGMLYIFFTNLVVKFNQCWDCEPVTYLCKKG